MLLHQLPCTLFPVLGYIWVWTKMQFNLLHPELLPIAFRLFHCICSLPLQLGLHHICRARIEVEISEILLLAVLSSTSSFASVFLFYVFFVPTGLPYSHTIGFVICDENRSMQRSMGKQILLKDRELKFIIKVVILIVIYVIKMLILFSTVAEFRNYHVVNFSHVFVNAQLFSTTITQDLVQNCCPGDHWVAPPSFFISHPPVPLCVAFHVLWRSYLYLWRAYRCLVSSPTILYIQRWLCSCPLSTAITCL